MTYGNMPLIIPVLAAGYLLTVYLLLALAGRTAKKTVSSGGVSAPKNRHHQELVSTTSPVSEVTTVR
ncbi:MAG: hypothetical protein VKL59_19445 [Nostocaceae cyanobacterium]|nr:hypothetical protein [Nostocaceae cyanobacterium]